MDSIKFHNSKINNYKFFKSAILILEHIDITTLQKYFASNNYDNLCKKILLKYDIPVNSYKNILKINKYDNLQIMNFIRPYLINKLVKQVGSSNNLIITNTFPILSQFKNFKIDISVQMFENIEMNVDDFKKEFNIIKNFKNINNSENNTINNYLLNKTNTKYDTIICKLNDFCQHIYIQKFIKTKIPTILFVIIQSLRQLNKNGNLYIIFRITEFNNTLKKIIYLLVNSFKNVTISHNDNNKYDTSFLINCHSFKDNISTQTMNKLIDICLKSRKYNYSLCQFMHYFYYMSKTQPDNPLLLYPFDYKDIGDVKASEIKQKTMKILDDIDANPKKSKGGEFLIYQIEQLYKNYFENINYTILRYIKEVDGKIEVDKSFFDKITYDNLLSLFKIYQENKIPYNKTYLVFINKYNKNLVNKLYGFTHPIDHHLVKYNPKKSKKKTSQSYKRFSFKNKGVLSKIGNFKSYHYEQLNDIQDTNILGYTVKEDLLHSFPDKKIPKAVKQSTEGIARGIARYALINFKLPHKTSNGYMKLWELYSLVPQLVPRRKQLNVFHLAEAPGQWINCTRHFIETKRQQVQHYNWLANSLNPTNPSNIAKYGKGIFGDDYGFLKRYPQKWLFGVDDTGDITKSANVRWFRDYMEKFVRKGGEPIHLVTGDAGMVGDIPLVELQKIEYAQMCMVAATSSIGGNCVIKHFLHYLNAYPNSYEGSGFMVSFIYIYYLMFDEVRLIKPHTSNPNSREFYLVGLRFRGVDDGVFNKLMKNLDNFEENHCFFKREDIPDSFSKQVIQFTIDLFIQNNDYYDIQNMLMTCIVNPDPVIEKATQCRKYLDEKFIKEIQTKRYKEWIKTYGFR